MKAQQDITYGEIRKNLKDKGIENVGNSILESIENLGLGTLSKTDFEALIVYHLKMNIDDEKIKDSYDWMKLLKITPSKLRNLELIASVKFSNLAMDNSNNWMLLAKKMEKKKIEIENKDKGTVRFLIDDVHTQRFIENFVNTNGSSLDYMINRNQIILKFEMCNKLLTTMTEKLGIKDKELVIALNRDKSEAEIQKEFTSLKKYFEDFRDEFKDKAIEEAAKTTFEFVVNKSIQFINHKLFGK
jgi:hypothetical protein